VSIKDEKNSLKRLGVCFTSFIISTMFVFCFSLQFKPLGMMFSFLPAMTMFFIYLPISYFLFKADAKIIPFLIIGVLSSEISSLLLIGMNPFGTIPLFSHIAGWLALYGAITSFLHYQLARAEIPTEKTSINNAEVERTSNILPSAISDSPNPFLSQSSNISMADTEKISSKNEIGNFGLFIKNLVALLLASVIIFVVGSLVASHANLLNQFVHACVFFAMAQPLYLPLSFFIAKRSPQFYKSKAMLALFVACVLAIKISPVLLLASVVLMTQLSILDRDQIEIKSREQNRGVNA